MLVTMNQDGQRILAKNASKCQHYVCPYCKSSVVFKHGCSMLPHFAHKGRTKHKCIKTDIAQHYHLKLYLAQAYRRLNRHVQIEPYFAEISQYPDIVVDSHYAIEVQLSKINISQIIHRTLGLKSIGLEVYWLIDDICRRKSYLELTQFQSSFINPVSRTWITWNSADSSMILYSQIQNISGKKFVAKRSYLIIVKEDKSKHINYLKNRFYYI